MSRSRRERAHHGNGEERGLMHQEEKGLLGDWSNLAGRLGARRSRTRRPVDQSHFTENAP